MISLTEQSSKYNKLEKQTVDELIRNINEEDKTVAFAIEKALPQLSKLISRIEEQLISGGRMFYLGCGSGGRLSVLDAIELPNTFGIEKGLVNVILAGGVENLVYALEEREDDENEGWESLLNENISTKDIVIGISASGTTPFVLATLKKCRKNNIPTGSIVSNPDSPISHYSDYPVEVITGPEFVTGSTRMKCGTAQKMIFDIISTTVFIRLGKVEGNQMVNARLTNAKVIDRSVRMLMNRNPSLNNYTLAKNIIEKYGNVIKAENHLRKQKNQ